MVSAILFRPLPAAAPTGDDSLSAGLREEGYDPDRLPGLFAQLGQLCAEDLRYALLDLRGVPRLSPAQLHGLVRCQQLLQRAGGCLLLADLSEPVQALLKLLKLESALRVYGDAAAACLAWQRLCDAERAALEEAEALRMIELPGDAESPPRTAGPDCLVVVELYAESLRGLPGLVRGLLQTGVRELCLDTVRLGELQAETLRPVIESQRQAEAAGAHLGLCRVGARLEPQLKLLGKLPVYRSPEDGLRAARLRTLQAQSLPTADAGVVLRAEPGLVAQVSNELARGSRSLIIDGSSWTSFGEAEMELLLQARERVAAEAGRMAIAALPGGARTLLQTLGIAEAFACFATANEAASALSEGRIEPLTPMPDGSLPDAALDALHAVAHNDPETIPGVERVSDTLLRVRRPSAEGGERRVSLSLLRPRAEQLPQLEAWVDAQPPSSQALIELDACGPAQVAPQAQLEALMPALQRAEARGIQLVFCGAQPALLKLLGLLELDGRLFFAGPLSAAAWLADELDKGLSCVDFEMVHCGIDVPRDPVHTPSEVADTSSSTSTVVTRIPGMTAQEKYYWIADDETVRKLLAQEDAPGRDEVPASPSYLEDDAPAPGGTKVMPAPTFLDDDDELEVKHKTTEMAAPSFLDEEEDELQPRGQTKQIAVPSFLDEEDDETAPAAASSEDEDKALELRKKTAEFSVPSFLTDEIEEEVEEAPAAGIPESRNKTAEFAVPSFLTEEDEEELPAARNKTVEFGVPNFLEEEDEEGDGLAPDGKTAKFGVPSFLSTGEAEHMPDAPRGKTAEFAVPNFLTAEDSSEEMPSAPARRKTAEFAVPNFLTAEADDDLDDVPPPAKKKSKSAEFRIPDFIGEEDAEDGEADPQEAQPADDGPAGFKSADFKVPEFKGGSAATGGQEDEGPRGFKSADFKVPSEVDMFSGEEPDFAMSDDAKRFQAAQTMIEMPDEGESGFRGEKFNDALGFQGAKTMVDMEAPDFDDEEEEEAQEAAQFQAARTMVDMEAPTLDDEEEDETSKHRRQFQDLRTMPEMAAPTLDDEEPGKAQFQQAKTMVERDFNEALEDEQPAPAANAGFQSAQTMVDGEDEGIGPLKRTAAFQSSATMPDNAELSPLRRATTEPEFDAVQQARAQVSGRHDVSDAPEKKSPMGMIVVVVLVLVALAFGGYQLFIKPPEGTTPEQEAVLESLGTQVDSMLDAGLLPE